VHHELWQIVRENYTLDKRIGRSKKGLSGKAVLADQSDLDSSKIVQNVEPLRASVT